MRPSITRLMAQGMTYELIAKAAEIAALKGGA
jgi:DNA-binding CsgD family transcriptional regulator